MATINKREIKINLLLTKGVELLWAKGYNNTSVNDIVKAADIPKGSFYFYFESKDDFVLKALDTYSKTQLMPVLEILKNDSVSPKSRLIKYYEYRINSLKNELLCQKGCLACNISNEVSDKHDAIRNKINSFHNKMRAELIIVVKKGQKSNEIDDKLNPKRLVQFIEDAFNGSLISMKETKSIYPVENVLIILKTLI